ncbi:protein DOG1-like 3 isoform X1 [Cynara cardunculus var. scolymus]|uniref:protein DOG1-like 3 isoform X1 n=1 Tax=Cynara cardunculus var. scolymus TaxID=59895 RepID=UPI000D62B798|nr:protein DOG1-like 3 isoform X1 [Cynara cardunculus var. scolymus]
MDFQRFYETWYDQLHHHIHHLTKAPRPPSTDDHHHQLTQLVNKVMFHFSEYYRVKSIAANQDVLSIFSARWSTTLERSLHWIAGWRPTTAFHLIYTESSILFESRILDILHGLRTGDLGDLSPAQFTGVSELQCETVQQENAITDQLSEWQQDEASALIGGTCVDLDKKIEGLVKIVEKADELRLRTLKAVVELLTPQQAVEFLIAAAQLHFGIHRWGLNHDRERAEK